MGQEVAEMSDTRRDQLIDFVEREFIGPDPIDWSRLVSLISATS